MGIECNCFQRVTCAPEIQRTIEIMQFVHQTKSKMLTPAANIRGEVVRAKAQTNSKAVFFNHHFVYTSPIHRNTGNKALHRKQMLHLKCQPIFE